MPPNYVYYNTVLKRFPYTIPPGPKKIRKFNSVRCKIEFNGLNDVLCTTGTTIDGTWILITVGRQCKIFG